jgi:hypothetical protein
MASLAGLAKRISSAGMVTRQATFLAERVRVPVLKLLLVTGWFSPT